MKLNPWGLSASLAVLLVAGAIFGFGPDNAKSQNASLLGQSMTVASSGNVANGTASATLTGVSGKMLYLTGFQITGSGATLALPVQVTVAGCMGGTMTYIYGAAAGALLSNNPLLINYGYLPIPAASAGGSITVSCPALGLLNTGNTVNVQGFTLPVAP